VHRDYSLGSAYFPLRHRRRKVQESPPEADTRVLRQLQIAFSRQPGKDRHKTPLNLQQWCDVLVRNGGQLKHLTVESKGSPFYFPLLVALVPITDRDASGRER